MKILNRTAAAVLAAVTAAAVWAVPAAAAASVQGISSTSCIADNANILSRDTETYITNISVALQENCSGAQIGVYTTDYVGNNTMEGYAYEVFQAWGLGSADQDNGMVLLMATGDDNYWATPGEGLESAFSGNVLSDLLYDNLEASWAKQDYDTGARKTVLAMAERICDVYGVSLDMDAIGSGLADSSGRIVENTQSRSNGGAVLTLILLTIIIAVIVIAILKTPRGPRGPQGPTYSFSADRFTGRAVPGVLPRRPLRAVDLVIPAHAPAAALAGLAPVLDLAVSVRVPAAALAECPAGSVPAAAVPGRVAVPGAAAGSAPRAVGAAASVPAAVPPAAAVPGADSPFAR